MLIGARVQPVYLSNCSHILLVSLSHGTITSPVYLCKDAMVIPVSLLIEVSISPGYWLQQNLINVWKIVLPGFL